MDLISLRVVAALALLAPFASCAHPLSAPEAASISLVGTDGVTHAVPELARGAPATLLVFFSKDCPCMEAHDGRLRDLAERFKSSGLRVFVVDSEFGATLESDRDEAVKRTYPFPILLDPKARLATTLGAGFASFSALFDARGDLQYSGGFDSSTGEERPGMQRWVEMAIEDLLAHRQVAHPHAKALGCALKGW